MKKILYKIILGLGTIVLIQSCSKELTIAPTSAISDANYWKTPDQVDAFMSGIMARFRSHNSTFQILGELRSDIFGTEPGSASTFTGEATQGLERTWLQTLNIDNTVVTSFGALYTNIAQVNLVISQLNKVDFVTPENKSYYLGMAYGIRAFYYFHLYKSYGDAVIVTEPIDEYIIDKLAKAASPAADVLALVKSDIDKSTEAYGNVYTIRGNKSFWSKAATLMLKGEVYLWTSHRGGGTADANTALAALTDIETNIPALTLLPSFTNVFATTNRGNNEMILVSRYQNGEATMGFLASSFAPQTNFIVNYYDSAADRKFDATTDNWNGLLRAPIKVATFRKFDDKDSRKRASIQAAYNKVGTNYVIAGAYLNKFQGEQVTGNRVYSNDYPIYRYADLLLLKAEAKVLLGQDPKTEINRVRARGFGANYNEAVQGYPNQAIDANPENAILQERLFEFVFEGKRWYDLRRFGDAYVYAQIPQSMFTNVDPVGRLLWPINIGSLTNNRALVQTPGYSKF